MRLVKLFSILLCIVLCISLSTITVFAARVVDEDGWYRFTNGDIVNVISHDVVMQSWENKYFPIYTKSSYGNTDSYYVDIHYNIGSENGWIVVPNGFTVQFESRVLYYALLGEDRVPIAGYPFYPFEFVSFGEDSNQNFISCSTSNYVFPNPDRKDIAIFSLSYTNNTGSDVYFADFRWGATSGLTSTDIQYAIDITWIKFRVLNSDEVMTDQILNGWDGSGNVPPEQEKVDEVGGVEEEVLGKVEDGATEAGTLFNDFGSQLLAFVPAFTVIGRCFGNFMEIPLISALLFIGLTIGVSGFLLGILPSVASAIRGNQMAKQHAERRSSNTSSNNKGSQKG